jgi:threonine dehydrogenase-like Zn-dependent dehydrogenase
MSQTTITPQDAVDALKAQHRATWADGDYPAVAEHIADALPRAALAQIDVAGARRRDVATGRGNLAIEAARAGATVTGVDLVPELIEAARRRATSAGVDIEWLVGDAEALPLPDDAFDATTSIVGVQFAPRSRVVADELIRVTRPGGTISNVGYHGDGEFVPIPRVEWGVGMGDKTIRTGLCPGGAERLRRLLRLVQTGRIDPTHLTTHRFAFAEIERAFEMMRTKADGIVKPLIVYGD